MKIATWFLAVAAVAIAAPANAQAIWAVTEAFVGLSGPDGTADWFELTNIGDAPGDTGMLKYDDANPTLANAGTLDSFTLAPGESAVFLQENDPSDEITYTTALEEFDAIWGTGITRGLTNGGGGLGQGGDEINIFDASDNLIASVETPAGLSGGLETINYAFGAPELSSIGVAGAYASTPFENAGLAFPGETDVQLIGSPGSIPEPTTATLLLAGLGLTMRRR